MYILYHGRWYWRCGRVKLFIKIRINQNSPHYVSYNSIITYKLPSITFSHIANNNQNLNKNQPFMQNKQSSQKLQNPNFDYFLCTIKYAFSFSRSFIHNRVTKYAEFTLFTTITKSIKIFNQIAFIYKQINSTRKPKHKKDSNNSYLYNYNTTTTK